VIISFAWTVPALIAGQKTVTRRVWSSGHAAKFHAGDVVDAWDKSPRAHGRRVATIEITRDVTCPQAVENSLGPIVAAGGRPLARRADAQNLSNRRGRHARS
jgi:hypothetical protein